MAVFAVHRAHPIGHPVHWSAGPPCSLDPENRHRAQVRLFCGNRMRNERVFYYREKMCETVAALDSGAESVLQ